MALTDWSKFKRLIVIFLVVITEIILSTYPMIVVAMVEWEPTAYINFSKEASEHNLSEDDMKGVTYGVLGAIFFFYLIRYTIAFSLFVGVAKGNAKPVILWVRFQYFVLFIYTIWILIAMLAGEQKVLTSLLQDLCWFGFKIFQIWIVQKHLQTMQQPCRCTPDDDAEVEV